MSRNAEPKPDESETGHASVLRESEARYQALVSSSAYVVYRMSPDWRELRQLEGQGFLADQVGPNDEWLADYIYPEDQPRVLAAIDEAVRSKRMFELEHRVRRADGTVGWTLSRAVPLLDRTGATVEWVGTATDVTARKEAEAALRVSQERLQLALDASELGTFIWYPAEDRTEADARMLALFDQPPDGTVTLASAMGTMIHPDDRTRYAAAVSRAIDPAGPGLLREEIRLRRMDGTVRWLNVAARVDFEGQDRRPARLIGAVTDITARKQTEAALRESEARYRTLFDSIDEGFCVVEVLFDDRARAVDYRFLEANRAFVQQTGLPDAVGRRIRELAPAHEPHWFDIYGRVAVTGEPVRFQAPAEALGRWYDVYAFRVGEPGARQVAVLFNDISERKRQADALQASWAQLAEVFELSPSFLAVLRGPDHIYELVNPALDRLLNHRQVIGRPVREAIPELGRQGFLDLLDQVYASGQPYVASEVPVEFEHVAGGPFTQRFLNFVFQPLGTTNGVQTGILVTGVDVTELVQGRRTVERTLVETQRAAAERDAERRQLLTVLEQAPLAVAITGPAGEILFRNAMFDRLWGRPPHETRAEAYSDVYGGYHLDGRSIASHEWPGARAVLQGEVVEGEVLDIVHASGRRITVWINSAPVRDAEGRITGAVVMFRDVTAERRTEQQLRDAQRLHAVGTLAGGVAHEVNNALQGTLGFGSFVLGALGPDHPQAPDMRLVLQSAQRAARVSQQLLAYTRQQVSQPRSVDLAALTQALRPVLQQLLGADKQLHIRPPSGPLPPIHADPSQVEQILINLIANARDATETGGRVGVEIGPADADSASTVDMGFTLPEGDYVRLAVEDDGSGMDVATLARIFDPFFTTKPVGEGTGLGLSMVHGIVKQHGGYVGGRSTPGQGTRMELYWPVARLGSREAAAPGGPAGAARGLERGKVVLVADDEPIVRSLVVRTLEEEGHHVLAAADGAAALELIEAGGVRPDLVVTDVVMPGLNGRQLHDAVRARWPEMPVLFLSGHTGEGAVLHRLVPHGAPFLQKPFTPGALAAAVARLLERQASAR